MTPEQQAALEALAGRPLTAGEIAHAAARNDGLLAASLSAGRTAVQSYWLTDRGLVADLYTATGSTAMSDSILGKLDGLAASSRSIRAMKSRLETDPQGVDFGGAGLRDQIQALGEIPVGGFSAAEVAALLALALARRPAPLSVAQISAILNGDPA